VVFHVEGKHEQAVALAIGHNLRSARCCNHSLAARQDSIDQRAAEP
jgi:hypothetical protein